MKVTINILLSFALLALSACGAGHITPYTPKERAYQAPRYAAQDAQRSRGSIWSEASNGLFEDARGRRVGDIITVVVEEKADASRDATTKTKRKSEADFGVSNLFTLMDKVASRNPGLDTTELIKAAMETDFEGSGSTTRKGALEAVLPVHIKQKLPNGDFFVEGTKVLLVNDEETHLYLSGVVRPIDIQPDNTVSSYRLADVQVEYTGRGVLAGSNSRGWLAKALDQVWPF